MKRAYKRIVAAVLCGAMMGASAGAITKDGQAETYFDQVWKIVDEYGYFAQDDPNFFQNYINEYLAKNPEEYYRVLNELLSMLDTHSMYLSAEQYSFGFQNVQNFIGIGVGLIVDERGVGIYTVMPYSAAEEAGLKSGDIILSVDSESVKGLNGNEAVERLRGEEGTDVVLEVMRGTQTLEVTCTRRVTNNVYVKDETLEPGIEYIKIAAMGSQLDADVFRDIWNGLGEKNTQAVILDLRGNGGGLVSAAVEMADLMTPTANTFLCSLRWREDVSALDVYQSTQKTQTNGVKKIIVLVDEDTMSSAELLAGTLKDNGNATLLGTQTGGKGQGQMHIPLVNGDVLVITSFEILLPKTPPYEGVGIAPNIVVENELKIMEYEKFVPFDTAKPILYGEISARVTALTECLVIFGYLPEVTNTYNAAVAKAIGKYCAASSLAPSVSATSQVLASINDNMGMWADSPYIIDNQLQEALKLSREVVALQTK